MPLTHLGCPSCGGTLSLAEGERLVGCRYCGRQALAVLPAAIPRYVVRLGVDREGSMSAAQAALAVSGMPGRPMIRHTALCYVPFYEQSGSRVGTFLLKEAVLQLPPPKEETEDGKSTLPERPMELEGTRVLEKDVLRVAPACSLAELGVDRIRLADLRRTPDGPVLEPYDRLALQTRAQVFSPTLAPEAAFPNPPGARAGGDRTHLIGERLKLLLYPVWQIRYGVGGRLYDLAIDGVTGQVLRGHAPLDPARPALLLLGALAAAGFCWGRLLRALLDGHPAAPWILPLGLGGIAALLVAWGAWRLREHRREVRHDGEEWRLVGAGESGLPEDLAAWLLGVGGVPGGTRT